MLISLNPYAHIPELYQIASFMKSERRIDERSDPSGRSVAEQCKEQLASLEQAMPHAYTLAKRVYTSLLLGMSLDNGGTKGPANFWATGGGDHTFRTTYFGTCSAGELDRHGTLALDSGWARDSHGCCCALQ